MSSLKDKVSVQFDDASAASVLQSLQQQTTYTFTFDNTVLRRVPVHGLVMQKTTLGEVLKWLRDNCGLQFSVTAANKNIGVLKVAARAGVNGRVDGQVLDEKNGSPVIGATVVMNKQGVTTDVEGRFSIVLPAGNYTADITYVGYKGKRITDVNVMQDSVTSINAALTPAPGTLAGVLITTSLKRETVAALYTRQKNNLAISDGISAEQIKATPDNNAAQVLKRVSGVVVQQDKFITIRGVSDRYNNVLINGALLPSTEPNRRNFSFDIVPSALIDNIVINKTATPDMPSEFTGGFVQINTRDVPAKNFLHITIGSGFNTASVGNDFLSTKRSPSEYFGAAGDNRKWFGSVYDPRKYAAAIIANDTAYMRHIGSRIPDNWRTYRYHYTPVQNYQVAGGMLQPLGNGRSVGFTAALTYRNEQLMEAGEKRSIQIFDYATERYRFNTAIGALLNGAWKTAHHRIAWKNLYNRRLSNQYDNDNGLSFLNAGTGSAEARTSSNLLVNTLWQTRLEGEHTIGRDLLKADWYVDYNHLKRDQPDSRYGRTSYNAGLPVYNFKETPLVWGGLFASQLVEERKNAGVNLQLPFTIANNKQLIKTGYGYTERTADYTASGLRAINPYKDGGGGVYNNWVDEQAGKPYYAIATPQNFKDYHLYYRPSYVFVNSTGDGYNGKQTLQSVYLMGDFRLLQQLRVAGGVRYEGNKMSVRTVYQSGSSDTINTKGGQFPLEKSWLPSANITWQITKQVNLRAAYSKTLARPDFVERSSFMYYDYPEQLYVYGDSAVRTTHIQNYDARIEYYPGAGEVLSFSAFYKDFTDPVERFFLLGNPNSSVTYKNLDKAKVKGIELDLRKSLSFINPGSAILRNFFFSGNFSYLKGKIETYDNRTDSTGAIKKVKVEDNRPVQGLTPYVINGGLTYAGKLFGFNISYNRFGRRIVYGGTYSELIQYESPRDVVDLQLNFQLIKQKLELRVNAADILAQPFVVYSNTLRSYNGVTGGFQGDNHDPKGAGYNADLDFVNYKVQRGANYSFTLTYKL
ncbi:TonB-dependent receptor [Deminuibacter soli]|uniref:TonB-dependent receptor n=1 Tax=Deminuibacter soli TaxID=2291815 RepID=UPI0013142264|nr:TonB-dependent receptor [Deminuibacter soli]